MAAVRFFPGNPQELEYAGEAQGKGFLGVQWAVGALTTGRYRRMMLSIIDIALYFVGRRCQSIAAGEHPCVSFR
jgi:hypothetical protein